MHNEKKQNAVDTVWLNELIASGDVAFERVDDDNLVLKVKAEQFKNNGVNILLQIGGEKTVDKKKDAGIFINNKLDLDLRITSNYYKQYNNFLFLYIINTCILNALKSEVNKKNEDDPKPPTGGKKQGSSWFDRVLGERSNRLRETLAKNAGKPSAVTKNETPVIPIQTVKKRTVTRQELHSDTDFKKALSWGVYEYVIQTWFKCYGVSAVRKMIWKIGAIGVGYFKDVKLYGTIEQQRGKLLYTEMKQLQKGLCAWLGLHPGTKDTLYKALLR